jgi:putative membrane protein
VLIGLVWLGLALAESRGLTLLPVMIFATFAGLAAIVIGVRIIDLGMTRSPLLSGVGYILPGLIGALSVPGYLMRTSRLVRLVGVVVLVAAGVLWAVTGYGALWGHIANYAGWVPATLRGLR